MCGRYYFCTYDTDAFKALERSIEKHHIKDYKSHEIRPLDHALVLILDGQEVIPRVMDWGMKGAYDHLVINARMESIEEKRMFSPIVSNRCLIPCNGFFEWKQKGKSKQKVFISKKGQTLMYLAGIYNENHEFVIVTGESQEEMASVHDRTPLFVPEHRIREYLIGLEPFAVDNHGLLIRKGS